jgi:hypothetical protein
MIIAIVIVELVACLILWLVLGAADRSSNLMFAPLLVGLTCVVTQLVVHYVPRRPRVRAGLVCVVALMLVTGAILDGGGLPYLHQALFIAGVAVLPQIWVEWYSESGTARAIVLCVMGPLAIPLGLAAWCFANIWIVKAEARSVAQGEGYCILLSDGKLLSGGQYHVAPDDSSLSGWRMFTGRGGGGSGDCCQWDFHALLLTQSDRLFNWSYASQRFEPVSQHARRGLRLNVKCQ